MKKIFLVVVLLGGMGIAATHHYADAQLLPRIITQAFRPQYEQLLIQDWLKYQNLIQQQEIPRLNTEKIDLSSSAGREKFKQNYVKDAKLIIDANNQNIARIRQATFATESYRNIQSLDMQTLTIMNQLFQDNVIDYYARHGDTQTFLREPALKIETVSKYQAQQAEIKVLEQLRILAIKKDRRLRHIDADLFSDWLDYSILEHQLYPRDAEWDTFGNLQKLSQRTGYDDVRELQAYQALQPRTATFKKIQQLNVQSIQSNLQIFADFKQPTNAQQALENIKALNKTMQQQDFKAGVELSNQLTAEQQRINKQMVLQLSQALL
ncbi:hypothetical protein QSV37_06450 [Acinetobacter sp. VNK23]|uniref:hypothetical protein n=1 Tax=Acinetobacter thutiue TaxID=2998078 RepID=UPI002577C66A|nr:hypothetical protein [Acinetobacter thutiue]MDM1019948.1 hypothetical protein [Acinetobacter thutiue]